MAEASVHVRRRELLSGFAASAALAVTPALARTPDDDVRLKAVLDGLGSEPGYAQRLARLAAFDPATLSPSARIDLLTVRRALEIDTQLVGLIPGSKTDGPYRLPVAKAGIWRLPKGAEAYALLLERHTGTPTAPEAAHRRLADEAQALIARADRLMRGQGFARGTVGARFKAMFADPRWHYPDSDAGRDLAVADMNRALDAARTQVSGLVGPIPPESRDVSVRRMSRAEEAASKSGYRQMPAPGQSGIYFVDLARIADRPRWTLESVVHHELLPGHAVQLPIEQAAGAHPLRIAYLPVFAESWAVHAEHMMASQGAYRGDTLGELGHIHWLLFRVLRGLVDTGMHHRRWSMTEARAQMDRFQGVPAYFATFEKDLDRAAEDPGARAAEALVWLALADRTRGLSGAALRRVNRQILEHGRTPLRLLGTNGRLGE